MTDERCPHCGGPVRMNMVDVGNGPTVEYMPGSYECARLGDCPGIKAKLDADLPLYETCPACNSTSAVRMMVEVPHPHWPTVVKRIPGELRCFRCEGDRELERFQQISAESDRLIEAVQRKNRPLLERLLDRWRNFWAMD